MNVVYDAAIVGGGAAGLSAALTLGRSCRETVVFDDGRPRNGVADRMHGFITRDGTPPAEMLALARKDLERYPSVTYRERHISQARSNGEMFVLNTPDGEETRTRAILLAMGVYDALPAIDGLEKLWGRRAFVCPYCDAWELRNKRLAISGKARRAVEMAQELWQWSDDLVICCEDGAQIDAPQRAWIERVGAALRTQALVCVQEDGGDVTLRFSQGESERCAALFLCAPLRQRYPLVAMLGAQVDDDGNIKVDERGRTGVRGVYAAGDAVTSVHQVVLAAASGVCAAMALNEDLLEQDVANVLR